MLSLDRVIQQFQSIYQQSPHWISRAPGRVNLIGEHTDYNGGFALPAAINREIVLTASLRKDNLLRLYSDNYAEQIEYRIIKNIPVPIPPNWSNYFLAVLSEFQNMEIEIPGLNILLSGDIPPGSGLSSSAAYAISAALLLNEICQARLSQKDLALIAFHAEQNHYINVQTGIMDQFISMFAQENLVLLIDCYHLDYRFIPFNSNSAIILIINSMKKRELMNSEYNLRRRESEDGLNKIRQLTGEEYPSIRHIPIKSFEQYHNQLLLKSANRLRHNLSENQRVHDFSIALENNDFLSAGELLYQSHYSLKNNYEVSCSELDTIVELCRETKNIYGCRMTGAGFGGCAVALAQPDLSTEQIAQIKDKYANIYSVRPEIYLTRPESGALIIRL